MDYNKEYLKYKEKYSRLQIGGKNSYCNLPKDAKLSFGSGGSDAIIAIVKDRVYKFFPLFVYLSQSQYSNKELNYIKYEIFVSKLLTNTITKNNLTPHIIEYYGHHKCSKVPNKIFKDCPDYTKYLLDKKNTSKKCSLLLSKGYPRELIKPMYVLEMEKGSDTLSNLIIDIYKKKWTFIENFLDCIFFQIFYTLEQVKTVYPFYSHNDLFVRNILIENKNYEKNTFIRYHFNGMIFDIPSNISFVKISDFGISQISLAFQKKYKVNRKLIKDPYRDYFSIIYDIYNGANLGSTSLYSTIINKNKHKQIDKYFNSYFNTKVIKQIIKNNKKRHLDWDWQKTCNNEFIKMVGMKDIDQYLKRFKKIYPHNKTHIIVEEYGN